MPHLDYGKDDFREIGTLSSMLPAYIRQCCRATYDGTDAEVLEAYRLQAYKVMLKYREKYQFMQSHIDLLTLYSPSDMWEMMGLIKPDTHDCLASTNSNGLPKRACLHCHYVGKYLNAMRQTGHIDKPTGKRYGKNGLLEKK